MQPWTSRNRGIQSRTDLDMLKHAIETQERLEGQKLDWPVVRRLQCMRGAFLSSHLAERCVSGDAAGDPAGELSAATAAAVDAGAGAAASAELAESSDDEDSAGAAAGPR